VVCLAGAGVIILRGGSGPVSVADPVLVDAGTTSGGSSDSTATPGTSASTSAAAATTATPAATAKKAATPAKTTSRAAARTTAATTTVTSVKKGASAWKFDGSKKAMTNSGVSWFYNWSADRGGIVAPKAVEFVPMIWGAQSATASTLATAKKNGKILLGFNEPDMSGQANMTVDQALALWPKLEATKMTLGSPAVAWGADQSGQWLDRFMKGARKKGYRVDFITLHWYGSDFKTADAVSQLQAYVKATYAKYHKPIWITEYALMNFSGSPKFPTTSAQAAFITKSTAMLQKLSYVHRYAWFAFPTSTNGADETGLYRPGGVATAAGKAYRAAGQ